MPDYCLHNRSDLLSCVLMYVYVCKIGEEKFGGFFVVLFMVRSIQLGRLTSALCDVCDCPNKSTEPLFQFWSMAMQRVTKRQLTDTVFHCTVATIV